MQEPPRPLRGAAGSEETTRCRSAGHPCRWRNHQLVSAHVDSWERVGSVQVLRHLQCARHRKLPLGLDQGGPSAAQRLAPARRCPSLHCATPAGAGRRGQRSGRAASSRKCEHERAATLVARHAPSGHGPETCRAVCPCQRSQSQGQGYGGGRFDRVAESAHVPASPAGGTQAVQGKKRQAELLAIYPAGGASCTSRDTDAVPIAETARVGSGAAGRKPSHSGSPLGCLTTDRRDPVPIPAFLHAVGEGTVPVCTRPSAGTGAQAPGGEQFEHPVPAA